MSDGFKDVLIGMLFAETDGDDSPLDSNYDIDDICPCCKAFIRESYDGFLIHAEPLLDEKDVTPGMDHVGHNFWLNTHGHGAGFWDGDYINGSSLSDLCDENDLANKEAYVGDDGLIHIMGVDHEGH